MVRPASRARATSRGPSAMKSPRRRRSRLRRSARTSLTRGLSTEVITRDQSCLVRTRPEAGATLTYWSREGVLGARGSFGRGQAAALGCDRSALDAVRRRETHLDEAVADALPHFVDVRRAHPRPQLCQLARHLR